MPFFLANMSFTKFHYWSYIAFNKLSAICYTADVINRNAVYTCLKSKIMSSYDMKPISTVINIDLGSKDKLKYVKCTFISNGIANASYSKDAIEKSTSNSWKRY